MGRGAHSLYHRVTFWVADTLHRNRALALRPLALATRVHRRRRAEVPLVLVTGSAGKTTTRRLIAEIRPLLLVGAFGAQRDPERRHAGVDLPAAIGAPVRALAAGEVTTARFERWYGNVVRVRHFANVETTYARLRRIYVKRGQRVELGETLGQSGRSGIFHAGNDYDYPHLHFELRVDGVPVDPTPYLVRLSREG